MTSFARRCAAFLAAAVGWLAGCASTGLPQAADAPRPPAAFAAATQQQPAANARAAPAYPDGPLQPLSATEASLAAASRVVAQLSPPADLWERIRRGFAMPNLESDLVRDREQWYASRPDYMLRMTERSSKYLFHIVEELERRNMPTELALLPFIESAFNPQAVSSAKAAGMWQFIPSTGRNFDLKQNVFRDDRRDVQASTRAALDYLQKLYGMFGDWQLALAAYNWGEGSVARAIAKNRRAGLGTSYSDLGMPMETRFYVPKLQAVKNIVARPEAYRTSLPEIENHPYFQSVNISRYIDVALAAQLAEVRLDDFKALNPSLNRPVILAAGMPQILLPWDNAAVFQRNLEAYAGGRLASWTAWIAPATMKPAEAARRAGLPEAEFRSVNSIPPNVVIRAGSTLLVPRPAHKDEDVTTHVAENGQINLGADVIVRRTVLKAGKSDSVASIARRYKLAQASVAEWNHVSASAAFHPGQQIVVFLPVRTRQVSTRSTAKPVKIVRRGSKQVKVAKR